MTKAKSISPLTKTEKIAKGASGNEHVTPPRNTVESEQTPDEDDSLDRENVSCMTISEITAVMSRKSECDRMLTFASISSFNNPKRNILSSSIGPASFTEDAAGKPKVPNQPTNSNSSADDKDDAAITEMSNLVDKKIRELRKDGDRITMNPDRFEAKEMFHAISASINDDAKLQDDEAIADISNLADKAVRELREDADRITISPARYEVKELSHAISASIDEEAILQEISNFADEAIRELQKDADGITMNPDHYEEKELSHAISASIDEEAILQGRKIIARLLYTDDEATTEISNFADKTTRELQEDADRFTMNPDRYEAKDLSHAISASIDEEAILQGPEKMHDVTGIDETKHANMKEKSQVANIPDESLANIEEQTHIERFSRPAVVTVTPDISSLFQDANRTGQHNSDRVLLPEAVLPEAVAVDITVVGKVSKNAITIDRCMVYCFIAIGIIIIAPVTYFLLTRNSANDPKIFPSGAPTVRISSNNRTVSYPSGAPTESKGSIHVISKNQKITAKDFNSLGQIVNDRERSNWFGRRNAMFGDSIAIGAWGFNNTKGAVYIYRENNSKKKWELEVKLVALDGISGDSFGITVAMYANLVVVGATQEQGSNSRLGMVYIYLRDARRTWVESQKILASDGNYGDGFGVNVGASENLIVVGSYGKLYFFEPNSAGKWEEAQIIVGESDTTEFGRRLATSNGLVTTTAFDPDRNERIVYIFARTSNKEWKQIYQGVAGYYGDSFSEISMSNDTVAVGSDFDYDSSEKQTGAVHIYTRGHTGVWEKTQKLVAGDRQENDEFGVALAVLGSYLVVGAYGDDNDYGIDAGAAYLFTRNSSKVWVEVEKLLVEDGEDHDWFGGSASASGNSFMLGTQTDDESRGAVYVTNFESVLRY